MSEIAFTTAKISKIPEFKSSGNVLVPKRDLDQLLEWARELETLKSKTDKLEIFVHSLEKWVSKMPPLRAV